MTVSPEFTITDRPRRPTDADANGQPGRADAPWLAYFTEEQKAAMNGWALVIWPDVQVTKRMQRHIVMRPDGTRMAVFKTLTECVDYAEALELAPVGLFVAGRAILASAALTPTPPSDANQLGLFDGGSGV